MTFNRWAAWILVTQQLGNRHITISPLAHVADWSTWQLTVTTALTEEGYVANVTVQIDDEMATDFATGMPRADGMGEIFVSAIINESILSPVAYQNLLPLPMAGVTVPTYSPLSYSATGIHYDLLSSGQAKPLSTSGTTPSYIDNFYYGYVDTVTLAAASTPTPVPSDVVPNPSNTDATSTPTTQPPTKLPTLTIFFALLSVAIIAVALIATILLVRIKKPKKEP